MNKCLICLEVVDNKNFCPNCQHKYFDIIGKCMCMYCKNAIALIKYNGPYNEELGQFNILRVISGIGGLNFNDNVPKATTDDIKCTFCNNYEIYNNTKHCATCLHFAYLFNKCGCDYCLYNIKKMNL